jgi:threonine synthase
MKFRSTRSTSPPVTLSEAIQRSIAPDGGLYVPGEFSHVQD